MIFLRFFILSIFSFTNILAFPLENENIIVCTSANYNSIIYQTHKGQIVGLEAELLEEFANLNHLKITYRILKFDGLIPSLLTKKCDILATAMMMTETRGKIVDFSLPIYQGKSYFIFKKEKKECSSNIYDLDYFDTRTSKVGILQASAQDDQIKKNPHIFQTAKILYYENESDIITAFFTNKISIAINGSQFYSLVEKKFPGKFCGTVFKDREGKELSLPVGMAFRKDRNHLTKLFNSYMEKLYHSGKYKTLLKKYEVVVD